MKNLLFIFKEKRAAIEECIEDYTSPIFIVGVLGDFNSDSVTTLSATIPREELIIRNNKYPEWLYKVFQNSLDGGENILYIKDFQDISQEEQRLFIDIICENSISSEALPENLKIIINSKYECPIIPEIREVIQYFKF